MIQQVSRPYEILVRFGDGGVVGAHYTELVSFVDPATGQTFGRPEETPAVPISLANAASILGEQTATYLERIAALEAELASYRGVVS